MEMLGIWVSHWAEGCVLSLGDGVWTITGGYSVYYHWGMECGLSLGDGVRMYGTF